MNAQLENFGLNAVLDLIETPGAVELIIDGYYTAKDPDSVFGFEWKCGYEITEHPKSHCNGNPWDTEGHSVAIRNVRLIAFDGHRGIEIPLSDCPRDRLQDIAEEIGAWLDEQN